MKMVVLDGYTLNPGDLSWKALEALGDLEVYDHSFGKEVIERAQGAEAIFVNKVPITHEVLEALPTVKYIGVLATGYNNIDVEACKKHNVRVTTVPSYGGMAVAQFAMGLLLELCHGTCLRIADVRAGKWPAYADYWRTWVGGIEELDGKTLGILGLGNIGRHMAKMAQAFGMNVIAYSRTERPEGRAVATYVSFDELLEKSDVISVHLPLTEKTHHIINEAAFDKMKDGVLLLNVARGPLIDEKALAMALENGKVGACALDVLEGEPQVDADYPLLAYDNCIVTPHIAWGASAARKRLLDTAVDNFIAWKNGKEKNRLV